MCWGLCCASCCAACAASAACSCVCAVCGIGTPRLVAKYLYGVLFLLSAAVLWVTRDLAPATLQYFYSFSSCAGDLWCVASLAVLRLSFGLVCFFLLMLLLTLGNQEEDSIPDRIHVRFWPPKVLAWALLLLAPFLIPAVVFQVYGQIAIAGSALFLVIQLISLINFVYVWNDSWLDNARMHPWMVVVAVLCYLLTIAGVVLCYLFFAPWSSCGLNIFFITFTLALIVLLSGVSCHPKVNAGPMTSGLVSLYLIYMCWSAIMSEPASEACNTRPRQTGNGTWIDILGFALALFSIAISVYSTGIDSRCIALKSTLRAEDGDGGMAASGNRGEHYNLTFFHAVFALGAMYLAMLFVGWDMSSMPAKWSIDSGWFSVWVKMAVLWMMAALYGWTMAAPLLFPGRDFG